MKKIAVSLFFLLSCILMFSQTLTQTVKGIIKDEITEEPLIGATIKLLDSNPLKVAITDQQGSFVLEDVPVGRQSFKIFMIGYKPTFKRELMISSGKEMVLEITLEQEEIVLKEVLVTNKTPKSEAINSMAVLSSRQFTVEETQKYAGGMEDPARLVSTFAGVTSPSVNNNGISVRGNSPSGLLWRIEGVEVPSPNHFADLVIAGSGLLTVLSSQMLGNSDFFTGAFPAEYGNATSGVFDINLRKGNNTKREYTLGAGLLGLEFATEGPFKKGKKASYLMNYRYSTLGLVSLIFPNDELITYQDLSFKVNIPTKKIGRFSFWGVGAYDGIKTKALDKTEWTNIGDKENGNTTLAFFGTSLNHKIAISSKSFLNSALSFSGYSLSHKVGLLNDEMQESLKSKASKYDNKLTFQSALKTYFSSNHINSTGFYINNLSYNLELADRNEKDANLQNIVDQKGASILFQFYTQSKLILSPSFSLNVGLHSQYFKLNNKYTLEPRVAVKYEFNDRNNLSLAYGLHSKIEPLGIYFIKDSLGSLPNKNLDIMKSQHVVMSFSSMLTENIHLVIEPYFQYLTDVPVSPYSYISTLNNKNNLFFNHVLVSKGTGRNIGIDFTLERYLNKGLYYMFTGSLFDSKYSPIDGIERNTRFNKNYVFNVLVGKEWQVGKKKNSFISANIRFNYLGGNRADVIDLPQSILMQEAIYGETKDNIAFEKKHEDLPILSFTLSYKRNHTKFTSTLTLQVLNMTNTKEFGSYVFNQKTQKIESKFEQNMIPNLSYKIDF